MQRPAAGGDGEPCHQRRQQEQRLRDSGLHVPTYVCFETPFPGTPLFRRLEQEGRLLTRKWWLDPDGCVGDVVFRPRRMSPEELQAACLQARRQFFSWPSILGRLADWKVNASSLPNLATFLALNFGARGDIDRRQGLQLGAGPWEQEAGHEPVSV